MRLNKELTLNQARLKTIKIEISAESKITLGIRVALTQEVAEAFGCLELIYAGNVPRSGVEKMVLEGGEANCEILLQNDNYLLHVTAESLGHYIAKMEGEGPVLLFELKFIGYADIPSDLIKHVKLDPLLVVLKPAQAALDLQTGEGLHTAVLTDAPVCESCEAGVTLLDGTLMHADGKVCIARQAATDEAQDGANGATLATAGDMGGTHQAETKKRRGRPPKAAAAGSESEPEPDFMESIQ